MDLNIRSLRRVNIFQSVIIKTMQELWQLYDKQGRPISGKGATKDEVFKQGLLHAGADVWIWRKRNSTLEVLVQKRSSDKRTWPNLYDISAAGHIDLDEEPLTAAVRETKEEIGLDISPSNLVLVGVYYSYLVAESLDIENEFQWIYLCEFNSDAKFTMQQNEVSALEWKSFANFKEEVLEDNQQTYVPHDQVYYSIVIKAIEYASAPN